MKKVLIIEDEKSIAEIERDYLEINGYEVCIKTNGKDGFEEACSTAYSLILLDLMLPGVNGFDLCKSLRNVMDIPILIVTAKKDDIDVIRGLGLGADDYVVKPFSPGELVARVNSHISRYERLTNKTEMGVDDVIIKNGNLSINPKSRRVFMDEDEIILKNKEFDILFFMASHPDTVFSKDDLFENIWGMDSVGDNFTVTVHINKLREKIEKDVSNPKYIETVWGAGYRFRVNSDN